ncbi:C4-dicarboxylate TRAP transporter large permease protein DctM [Aliiroseovarius pelagivivens]|uniref:C4-dicarboxylate TRAP transporter large permease protein DctM n=1 Tax=Aliiroseovarius pelagivivens TaxID=1639690 RepID=A0A2R8AI75_9RHOB|nr:TRAP transporter fused permease subunit [Aliiroseovarius pelagivivens]SPF75753.1 C4-dicarboxylate TRAP transporter large permease protein DctM [Aliiroseovarius pelagivivens]
MSALMSSFGGINRVFSIASVLACAALGVIALYSSGLGLLDPKLHRATGFALALIVGVALSQKTRAAKHKDSHQPLQGLHLTIDIALVAVGIWAIWSFFFVQTQMEEALYDVSNRDAWPALAGLAVFLELCRRIWGWGLFTVGSLAVIYLFVGQHAPGLMEHTGFTLKEVAEALWYNTNKGVFGSITNIVLVTVFIFIIFGVLLEGTGAGDTLLKFAFLATRRTRGGPAHAAILASSMFGTMSGSTVANIVGTGTFTIPMIKKRGFSPTFAAGIEATASSGGQIMPPIMGAAALVMADLTGVGYLNVIVAALFPALFYYFSLFSAVTVEARRQGIEVQALTVEDKITRVDMINSVLFIGPIATVIASLIGGVSTSKAGFYAVIVLVLLSVINPDVRNDPKRLWNSFVKGAQSGATLLIAIAAIGILVGSLDSTGLGLKLANVISAVRGESLFSALLVAMLGALVLGMGMPTLPAYLIIILVMGPAIQALGVSMLTAHMFVFYYGVASSLTPPVAIAAYAAAPIAGANPLMTALMSFRLGMSKFIIPFIFAFYPTILIIEEFSLLPFLWIVARTCFCIWLFSSALSGFDRTKLTVPEIVLRFLTAFTLLAISPVVHLPALAIGVALILFDIRRSRTTQQEVAS